MPAISAVPLVTGAIGAVPTLRGTLGGAASLRGSLSVASGYAAYVKANGAWAPVALDSAFDSTKRYRRSDA